MYCLGDVHGDYRRLVTLLVRLGLAAESPDGGLVWTGRKATLVCTGDFINKHNQSLRVIDALRLLQFQAGAAGGQVLVTLGNHERAALAGRMRPEFCLELEKAGLTPEEIVAGQDPEGIGRWLMNLPVAIKIGDWFFAHAGNTSGQTLAELEMAIEDGVKLRIRYPHPLSARAPG